jgi:hypothetical protein
MAAAVRCRHCGCVFDSARPVESDEFARATALRDRAPQLKRSIIRLFIFCVVPLSAPVAAVVAWMWRHAHDEDLRSLPALYPALLNIGCAMAVTQTAAIVLVAVIFSLAHS